MKIEFIKDYATKKNGDVGEFDGQLARTLINLGVAKKFEAKPKKAKTKKQ